MADLDYCYPYLRRLCRAATTAVVLHSCRYRSCHSCHSCYRPNRNYPLECVAKRQLLLVQLDRDKLDNSSGQTLVANMMAPILVFVGSAVGKMNSNWVGKHMYSVAAAADNHLSARLDFEAGHHLHDQLENY